MFSRRADYLTASKLRNSGKNPGLTLDFYEGELKGTKLVLEKNLMYQLATEQKIGQVPEVKDSYSIGKDNISDYAYPNTTLKQLQCIIEFHPIWGWQIKDPSGNSDVSRTCVYLASITQIQNCQPSQFVQLFNGMILCAGDHDLEVSIRNMNPTYPTDSIFADDFERYLEETEDEVRKKMTGI